MLKKLRQRIANFISGTQKNAMTLPNQFLRLGNKMMHQGWSQVVISDQDLYTGYAYAAIRKRANSVARIALENIKTKSTSNLEDFKHPYLDILSRSKTFSDYQFWYNISTFLDLEGVFYLLVIRNFDGSTKRYGTPLEFKLLNPYRIRRVVKVVGGEVIIGGYVETQKNGYIRELPASMIIEMRELNPFDENQPYAMTDAAKESQFTIKTAGDYTRETLKHNINAPGILTTDVVLPDTDFANFVARVKDHSKGEPIFGNGKGAIDWNSMNIDLSKSALKDVNDLSREVLFAVMGMSKTAMGIEQSGVTRESSKVQKDLLNESEVLPRIQTIIDPLNQDYRNNYQLEFKINEPVIIVENPNASDHEAEIKEVEVKQKRVDLYNNLLSQGYDQKLVADYVIGKIDIEQLGIPKKPKVVEAEPEKKAEKKESVFNDTSSSSTLAQESSLQNAVVNIDQHLVADCIEKIKTVVKNEFESDSDIISSSDKREYISELEAVLVGFYGILMLLEGGTTMRNRQGTYALPGSFTLDAIAKKYIKETSKKVAESHIQTVVDDVLTATRAAALEGKTQREIIAEIRNKYDETISETRAKTIARTETNRAFTRAQFEADRQFIKQNKLSKRAYKRWTTRSSNPCAFCQSLAKGPLILFSNAFAELGTDIDVDGKKLPVSFERLEAGNAHPNCSCIYELVIISEDDNALELEAENKQLKKQITDIENAIDSL